MYMYTLDAEVSTASASCVLLDVSCYEAPGRGAALGSWSPALGSGNGVILLDHDLENPRLTVTDSAHWTEDTRAQHVHVLRYR